MSSGRTILCYYGSAGHGCGLVDGMSSWGIKNPLQKEIINVDFYELGSGFGHLFKGKQASSTEFERMYYTEVTQASYLQIRPEELPIKGSQKVHCIAFHPDGTVQTRRDICDCDECFEGNFQECDYCDRTGEDVMEDADKNDNEENENLNNYIDLLDVVNSGQVIALRTPKDVHESFYLCVVESVRQASTDIFDSYEHFIMKDSQYCCM